MEKFFNTAGPNKPDWHYTLNPFARLLSIRDLVEQGKYFILHAPRQTGKTTIVSLLAQELTKEGKYIGLYVNVESAQAVRNDAVLANHSFVRSLQQAIRFSLPKEYHPPAEMYEYKHSDALSQFLSEWCAMLPKPLVLFIDEADALIGDSLISLLRQVRSGYNNRPHGFPHSLALVGLRDLRDYRIFSDSSGNYVIGGSAFNIKDESLTISNFTIKEIRDLYEQHTTATGQVFGEGVVEYVYEQTGGQPWLVNALGKLLCFGKNALSVEQTILIKDVEEKIEELILRRDTHLDQLADKLTEPRVARIIERILVGQNAPHDEYYGTPLPSDDVQYVIDLGLIKRGKEGLEPANPIYREIIPRELTWEQQISLAENTPWYQKEDGRLDMEKLLKKFIRFYQEHGEMITKRKNYNEAAQHLMFLAWLQRIVNGGGKVYREYASGLGRMDVLIEFADEQFVFELKKEGAFAEENGIEQTASYLKRMSLEHGYLLIFRRVYAGIEKIGERKEIEYEGKKISVLWI